MQLPDDFIQQIRPIFGEERFLRFLQALDEEAPVSIRVNPRKVHRSDAQPDHERCHENDELEKIPWCRGAYYLPTRPNFTFDPLLHAGCYYVQEASSMFLDEVLRQHLPALTIEKRLQTTDCKDYRLQTTDYRPITCLDLCAAPGGKSTLLRSALSEGCMLYSNEPNRKRASILLENVTKWGYNNHVVTCCYPKDYRKAKMKFDLILCDVPCSGEGMFRKDPDSIKEWSLKHVEECQQLQREIVSDAWSCLNDGGLFIYSTCTYNVKEDEENVRWMLEKLGAEPLSVETKEEWGITGSLLPGFTAPVYRFIPGYTRGEGLFMAVMRKNALSQPILMKEESSHTHSKKKNNHGKATSQLNILSTPLPPEGDAGDEVSLTYLQAISYLRGEALILPPDAPRGIVTVTFMGHALGPVKNIGNRANNLYPKEWRIKSTHVPADYTPIFDFLQ